VIAARGPANAALTANVQPTPVVLADLAKAHASTANAAKLKVPGEAMLAQLRAALKEEDPARRRAAFQVVAKRRQELERIADFSKADSLAGRAQLRERLHLPSSVKVRDIGAFGLALMLPNVDLKSPPAPPPEAFHRSLGAPFALLNAQGLGNKNVTPEGTFLADSLTALAGDFVVDVGLGNAVDLSQREAGSESVSARVDLGYELHAGAFFGYAAALTRVELVVMHGSQRICVDERMAAGIYVPFIGGDDSEGRTTVDLGCRFAHGSKPDGPYQVFVRAHAESAAANGGARAIAYGHVQSLNIDEAH
jgi:hypothetical protein